MSADPLTSHTVDDLLLDDVDFDIGDAPFADRRAEPVDRDDKANPSPRKRKALDEDPFGKGIDEEVKIAKQRKKIPKLDTERLLSELGIPKIRTLVRSGQFTKKLRLKGKGHEFSDVAKLLSYYQLWLDKLYPRAKFADAIQLVEKAGHTKRMQMYRKSWIDEGKPGFVRREEVYRAVDEQDAQRPDSSHVALPDQPQEEEDPTTLFFDTGKLQDAADVAGPDEDELEALMAQESEGLARLPATQRPAADSEGEDDLDALLAQAEERRPKQVAAHNGADRHEIDALLNAPPPTFKEASHQQSDPVASQTVDGEDDELDELLNDDSQNTFKHVVENGWEESKDFPGDDIDELDVLINGTGATYEPELPPVLATTQNINDKIQQSSTSETMPELDNAISSSPIPNVRTDELDDLMDAHDAAMTHKNADLGLVTNMASSTPTPNAKS